jgi:hypothetical protein
MARRCKSLKAPDQGYQHRDHRSRKGRELNLKYKKKIRYIRKEKKEELSINNDGETTTSI